MAKFAFNFAGTRDEAVEQVRRYFFEKYDLDFNIRTRLLSNRARVVVSGPAAEVEKFVNTELTWTATK